MTFRQSCFSAGAAGAVIAVACSLQLFGVCTGSRACDVLGEIGAVGIVLSAVFAGRARGLSSVVILFVNWFFYSGVAMFALQIGRAFRER